MNIYQEFKKELGLINVTNQFMELLLRNFKSEHDDLLNSSESLLAFSRDYNINLQANIESESIEKKIAQLHIISINSVFEKFLESFRELDASPVKGQERGEGVTLAKFILNRINVKESDKVRILYQICDYYRLLRNQIIHKDKSEKDELKSARYLLLSQESSEIKKLIIGKLKVAKSIDEISFDDQVLFSKAAQEFSRHIYYEADYNYKKHIEKHKDEIRYSVLRLSVAEKRAACIKRYLGQAYPVNEDTNYESLIELL